MVDQKIALDNCTEAVCIDASRIYDSCCDKDCLEDMKVYFTDCVQPLIDQAINVKVRSAEVINVITDVEPVAFNRGFFSVDITFFVLVKCYIYTAPMAPAVPVTGLAIFNKKCILFGSEGSVKVFGSEYRYDADDEQLARAKNTPRATVQVVEPIVLAARINEECDCCCEPCCCVPKCVCKCFEGNFGNVNGQKEILVTLGVFSIVQLSRNVQMLIPVYDFCVPEKECSCSENTENPCDLFKKIKFPKDEFFPPRECDLDDAGCGCNCGCK